MWHLSNSWPNLFSKQSDLIPTLLESSLDSWLKYSKTAHRYAKNSPFSWFLYLKLPIDTDFIHFISQFHQSCGINAREYFQGQLHLSKACWELWLSDGQPNSDYNGQWQRALCMIAVLHSSQPNPQRNKQERKMYGIKQIKICAEYRDMLPRPRLDLSGTPGVRPIPWQTSLGLGSMSRYSAQILIYIIYFCLTHLSLVPYIWVSELGQDWFRYWLGACPAPSHYLKQSWLIVNWTPGNKFQWNSIGNLFIFIQ